MRKSVLEIESLLGVAMLRKQHAQSAVSEAKIGVAETQAKLDSLRNQCVSDLDMTDLGLAAASALWAQKRIELLLPIQSEMANRLTTLSIAKERAAKSSAVEEAIEFQLQIANWLNCMLYKATENKSHL